MKPRSVRGFDWLEEPTESSEEMPLMRRRPLARAAMVGGTAYVAGKHHAQNHAREADQEAQIQELQAQQQYAAAAPAPPHPPEAAACRRRGLISSSSSPTCTPVTDLIAVGLAAAEDVPA
jgi:hypothetical protein